MPANTGGLKLSIANNSFYTNENIGDILVYATNAAQHVLVGPSNSTGQAILALSSNQAEITTQLQIDGTTFSKEIVFSAGNNFTGGQLSGNYQFSNAASFASSSIFAGSNTMFMGSNTQFAGSNVVFACAVNFVGSNNVTVGSNTNTQYPLWVQNVGSNNISLYVSGDQAAFSDSRWKTDIEPITDALTKVNAIGGYTFGWLDRTTGGRSAGVLAQEVLEVLPEVVRSDDEGKLNVAYGNLSALLIQAIKELSASQKLLSVTTTTADEAFSVALPAGRTWTAAFISGGAQYARSFVAVGAADPSTGLQSAAGSIDVPGTYRLLAL